MVASNVFNSSERVVFVVEGEVVEAGVIVVVVVVVDDDDDGWFGLNGSVPCNCGSGSD